MCSPAQHSCRKHGCSAFTTDLPKTFCLSSKLCATPLVRATDTTPASAAAAGSTRLAQAQGSARLNDQLQLTFNVDLSPADGHRTSGHLRAEGRVPLASLQQPGDGGGAAAAAPAAAGGSAAGAGAAGWGLGGGGGTGAAASAGGAAGRRDGSQPLDVRVEVRDGGMAILTSVTPDLRWQHGNADVAFRYVSCCGSQV